MLKLWKILHQQHGICLVPASETCLLFWSGINNKGSLFTISGNWRISTCQGHTGQVSTLVTDGLIYKARQWPDLGLWTLNTLSCPVVIHLCWFKRHSAFSNVQEIIWCQCSVAAPKLQPDVWQSSGVWRHQLDGGKTFWFIISDSIDLYSFSGCISLDRSKLH